MSPNPPDRRRDDDPYLKNPGKRYAPSSTAWYGHQSAVLDGTPVFTWFDVPRMIRDPQILFGLRMLRSPFGQAKWKIRSDRQAVADFVDGTLRRFWQRVVPKLLHRYFMWGYSAATLEYTADRRVRLKRGKIVEPRDLSPLVYSDGACKGEFAGFNLTSAGSDGTVQVLRPHAVWFAGHEELGHLYDRPRIAGAFEPWLEKNGRNGARASCRLWFRKCAIAPGTVYYPPGETNVGTTDNPDVRNNQDLARELGENVENGGVIALPNIPNETGTGRKWEYDPPKSMADAAGILDYPKELDRQILIGLGIPPEVIEAAATGSGFSGRKVPAMAYLGSADELVGMLIEAAETCFLRDLTRHNFGRKCRYEIEPVSLVDALLADEKPASASPGATPPPPGGTAPQDGEGQEQEDPLAALMGGGSGSKPGNRTVPYQGKRGGVGVKDTVTGRVRYGADLSLAAADVTLEQAAAAVSLSERLVAQYG